MVFCYIVVKQQVTPFSCNGGDFEQFGPFTPNANAVRHCDDCDFGHFGGHVARFVGHYHRKVHREHEKPARQRGVFPPVRERAAIRGVAEPL